MSFAPYDDSPPYYKRTKEAYYDEGNGVPRMTEHNMTVQDIYRTPFLFLQDHHSQYEKKAELALKNVQCQSDLSKKYFSSRNIRKLQKMIKKEVFNRTKGKYRLDVDQDEQSLFLVMRAVYMEHGRFLPNMINEQLKDLNNIVITQVIPDIITNIKSYYGYLEEINGPLKPIDRPVNINNAGRKTLPSISTTFEGLYGF